MRSELTTFDGTERILCAVERPDKYSSLFALLKKDKQFIPRGAGLSYSAASMDAQSEVILSSSFNRLLEFDDVTGILLVEAGARLGDILNFSVSRGWYPPVLPGHPTITVGGAVAFNVHGKSQFAQGCFDSCVQRLWLLHPLYGEIECTGPHSTHQKNSEIFDLTIGGMGLTGFITRVELRLQKLGGSSIERTRVKVKNLQHAVETMENLHQTFPILYSWNNLNLSGERFGEGILYAEKFASVKVKDAPSKFNVLFPPPRSPRPLPLLNNFTAPIMCGIYGVQEKLGAEKQILPIRAATFPINGKEFYFGLFGAPGFREYQAIIPKHSWQDSLGKIRDAIKQSGVGISLGSLKLFEGKKRFLNFTGEGVCLAIDVPSSSHSLSLFETLDRIMFDAGAVINLSKDNRISKKLTEKIFPDYEKFLKELLKFDPKKRCISSLRTRIGL